MAKQNSNTPSWSIDAWLPLILAAAAFFLYTPSLFSDFVYDARIEIEKEGFITSLANLPDVLTLKVLGSTLMLADRPGQLLYLMTLASVWGQEPWGYHLGSNLLHAANVALLFVLMRRLVASEWPEALENRPGPVRAALAATTLIFAVHPLEVETVAAVNFSSDLLVTLFTLLTLLAALQFAPAFSWKWAAIGTLCAVAAVTCKESGIAASLILVAYWLLYRQQEARQPWLAFLAAALTVTTVFLVARFAFATAAQPRLPYLGGSPGAVFLIQPRLWVFMFLKLIWPANLSADYTLENVDWLPLAVALPILLAVLALQGWLAAQSRLGALGVALFWLGLATVSNFVPLHRVVADRFYYLPLAAGAMQLTAGLMSMKSSTGFRAATTVLFVAAVPLLYLSLARQPVFASDLDLWTDTIKISPQSDLAHNNLAESLAEAGRPDEAIAEAKRALELNPGFPAAYNILGWGYALKGQVNLALPEFERAVQLDPSVAEIHSNLGAALLDLGRVEEAAAHDRTAILLRPHFADAHVNLGNALFAQNRLDAALDQFRAALAIKPGYAKAHEGLGLVLSRKGQVDDANEQFRESLAINPNNAIVHYDLGVALLQAGRKPEAAEEFTRALQIDPHFLEARDNLTRLQDKQPFEATGRINPSTK